jgi:hypothetical protein
LDSGSVIAYPRVFVLCVHVSLSRESERENQRERGASEQERQPLHKKRQEKN